MPTVVDVLDPRCLDYSEQMKSKGSKSTQKISQGSESSSKAPSSGWQKKFWDELSEAMQQAPLKNLCFELVTSGGTLIGVFEDGSINRGNKTQLLAASRSCREKVMKQVWPIIKEEWIKVGSSNDDCAAIKGESSKSPRLSSDSNRVTTEHPTLSQLLECALSLKDSGSRGLLDQNGVYDSFSDQIWGKWLEFDSKTTNNRVTVEINIDKNWGDGLTSSSTCALATIKR